RPSGKARGDATSAAYSSICEHWREPHNAAWRPQAQFFNSLLDLSGTVAIPPQYFAPRDDHFVKTEESLSSKSNLAFNQSKKQQNNYTSKFIKSIFR
ncbi:MAG: hypothetical protein RBR01_03135, partial [Desulfobacterales bacterium]|nr:hypothetical protein [Desulfobacterales bacterium]